MSEPKKLRAGAFEIQRLQDRIAQLEADLKGSIEARKQLGRIVKARDEWIRNLEAKLERIRKAYYGDSAEELLTAIEEHP